MPEVLVYRKHVFGQGFWCTRVKALIKKINNIPTTNHVNLHDFCLEFVNDTLFLGEGAIVKGRRKKGETYPDLVLPSPLPCLPERNLEYKFSTCEFKYLKKLLSRLETIFKNNYYLCYSYFLIRCYKNQRIILKDDVCIYYMITILISKTSLSLSRRSLFEEIKMCADEITRQMAEESGIDEDEEELLGVKRMLQITDLERTYEILKQELLRQKEQEKEELLRQKEQEKEALLRQKEQEKEALQALLRQKEQEKEALQALLRQKEQEMDALLLEKDRELKRLQQRVQELEKALRDK
ncbi:MAG: hypothetical protein ACTSWN_11615 [Promethearchaeota archaeon]